MTRIKICGITLLEDAIMCANAGVDLLGLNFYPQSPRYVPPEHARRLSHELRAAVEPERCPLLVGVFVNMSVPEITVIMQIVGLDAVQLSGDESTEMVTGLARYAFKTIRPRNPEEAISTIGMYRPLAATDDRLPSLLLDAYHKECYGGTGEQTDLAVACTARRLTPRLMLAGGLTPANVAERVRAIRPWGVDVASGVEHDQPARKDRERLEQFIAAVSEADHEC